MFSPSFEYVVDDPRQRMTVGQRKHQKAIEREGSIMSGSSGESTSQRPPSPRSKGSSNGASSSSQSSAHKSSGAAKSTKPSAATTTSTKPKGRFAFFSRSKVHEKAPSVSSAESVTSVAEVRTPVPLEPKTNGSLTSLQSSISNSTPSTSNTISNSTISTSTNSTIRYSDTLSTAPSSIAPFPAPTSQLPPTPIYDPDEILPIHGTLPARRPPPSFPVPPTPDEMQGFSRMRSDRAAPNFSDASRPVSNVSYKPILSTTPTTEDYISYPLSARSSKPSSQTTSPLVTPVENRVKLSAFPVVGRPRPPAEPDVVEPTWLNDDISEDEELEQVLDGFHIVDNETKQKFRETRRPSAAIATHQRRLSVSKDQKISTNAPFTTDLPPYEAPKLGPPPTLAVKEPTSITLRSSSRAAGEARQPPSSGASGRTSFQQALYKMENAGLKIMCKRLSEDWSSDESESSFLEEVAFEQRMWGLVAYQFLTFGRSLQSGAHELMSDARVEDGRRLLHLHGTAADGWVLAARYPNVTVYSVSTQDISNPACSWPAPLNHHPLYIPFANSPLPFPDNYFDVISSKSLPAVLKADEWIPLLKECYRVLRPGGWLEVQIVDPSLTKQGERLTQWLDTKILRELAEDDYSVRPSEDMLANFGEAGFQDVRRSRIALPAVPVNPRNTIRGQGPDPDATRVMVLVGRHFYEELYRGFVPVHAGGPIGGEAMWWNNRAIKAECEALNTCFGLVISFGQKAL